MKKEIIYISYDGLLEAIGTSQIYKYIINLNGDYKINLITFEKRNDLKDLKKINEFKNILDNKNIVWIKKIYTYML